MLVFAPLTEVSGGMTLITLLCVCGTYVHTVTQFDTLVLLSVCEIQFNPSHIEECMHAYFFSWT